MSKPAVVKPTGPPETVQPAVLYKLILFATLMAVVPIGTYFATLNYLFNGSTTSSAISAIVTANLVLVGYVVVAFREDAGPVPIVPGEHKKDR